jgi:hypothetical protein
MTETVSPAQFIQAFRQIAVGEEKDLYGLWWKLKKYTEKFLAPPGGVMAQVAQLLGLQYLREKVRVDAMLYRPANGFPAVLVAVEHEHDAESAHSEIWKLSLLNSPLKVLVTYPENGQEALLLDRYAGVLKAVDVCGDAPTRRQQLVIFGFADQSERSVEWRSYLYGESGFKLTEGQS